MKTTIIFSALIAGLFLGACSSSKESNKKEAAKTETADTLGPVYRLHDIWALEELGGKPLDMKALAENRPYIEIHVADKKVFGMAGCNRIFGTATFPQNDSIAFGVFGATRMMCPGIELEQQFLEALTEQSYHYKIENLRLILENPNNKLVFKKVD
jgi:heat shock protein HslJ